MGSTANGQNVTGSWYSTGYQQLVNGVKLLQVSSNSYGVFVNQGSNTSEYSATAALTNASFSHSCQSVADPGTGNTVTILPQQYILNGFSVIGNSTGVLSNAIAGQPWLFNSNSIIYANYPNVGIGTNYPTANLDVRGSLNFTGALLNNGQPLAVAQILSVSNAFVSPAADPNLYAANLGIVYPSSMRIGDYSPPSGVLEAVQGNTVIKLGGLNGRAGDISTNSNTMSFNISSNPAGWTFAKLGSYANLATKSTVATIDNTGSYIQASDRRYKHDIDDIGDDKLDMLRKLRPRQYQVNGYGRQKYGLIAQEVREVLPEIVHENDAGFLSVDYMAIVPMLLKRLQQLEQLLPSKS